MAHLVRESCDLEIIGLVEEDRVHAKGCARQDLLCLSTLHTALAADCLLVLPVLHQD